VSVSGVGEGRLSRAGAVHCEGMDSNLNFLFAVLAGIVLVSVAMLTRSCGGPDVPRYFERKLSLEDAAARAVELDRPLMMVLVDGSDESARFRRGPLASSRVSAWAREKAVAVLVDVSGAAAGDAERQMLLTRHQVEALPAVIVLKAGRELGRKTGFVKRAELATWLESLAPGRR
jgi:hypothetical protein